MSATRCNNRMKALVASSRILYAALCLLLLTPESTHATDSCPASFDAIPLTSGNSYHYVNCAYFSYVTLVLTSSAEPAEFGGVRFNTVVRNVSIIIDGGELLPTISLDTLTSSSTSGPRLLENITITYRNIRFPAGIAFSTFLQLFAGSSYTTSKNVRVSMFGCTLPTNIAAKAIDIRHANISGLVIELRDSIVPWELSNSLVSVFAESQVFTGLVLTVVNLTTNSIATAPVSSEYLGWMFAVQTNSLLTNASLSVTGLDVGAIGGNGGLLFVFGGNTIDTTVSLKNVVLPKNTSRRSFIIQAAGSMTRMKFVVDGLADAPLGYVAPSSPSATRGSYENATTFVWANTVTDSTFQYHHVTLLRPSYRRASWFAIRAYSTFTGNTFSFLGVTLSDAILDAMPAGNMGEHAGDCGGAFICIYNKNPINVALTWSDVVLRDVTASVVLLQWFGLENNGVNFTDSSTTLANWVVGGGLMPCTFHAGWVQLYSGAIGGNPTLAPILGNLMKISLSNIAFLTSSSSPMSTTWFVAPVVHAGWRKDSTQQLFQPLYSLTHVISGIHVHCRNVTGNLIVNSSFIAFYADTSVSSVRVVFQGCTLEIESTPCYQCFTLTGRATHVSIGLNVLQSVAVVVDDSSLSGITTYQGKGYTLSLICLSGPLRVEVPTVGWNDVNTSLTHSRLVVDGSASSAVNWWFVNTVVGAYFTVDDVQLTQWARSGVFGYLDSSPRCNVFQMQAKISWGAVSMTATSAVFSVYGGQPDFRLGFAVSDSAAGQMLVLGAMENSPVTVTNSYLYCVIENGTLTPASIDPYIPTIAGNQVSISIALLDPRTVSTNSTILVKNTRIDSVVNVQTLKTVTQGILASCTAVIVAGNSTNCSFIVDTCTITNNSTLIAPTVIPRPRLVAAVFFQPLAKLLASSLPIYVQNLIPNLDSFKSNRHENCTILVTGTTMIDASPPASIVLAVFILPADNSYNYRITLQQCTMVPVMRGAMALYDYPIYVGGGCFSGCILRGAVVVVDGVTGLVPAVWALTGGQMILSEGSTLRIRNCVLACEYHLPTTASSSLATSSTASQQPTPSFPHATNCSVMRFVSRGIQVSQPGSLEIRDTSSIEVSSNQFGDSGYASAVLGSDNFGLIHTDVIQFTSPTATWRLGCNVIGVAKDPLPGRLSRWNYFEGVDAAHVVFPPDGDLPRAYSGVVCRPPSGGETKTATLFEPMTPPTRPVVQAMVAATTAQTWALVGTAMVSSAVSGAAGGVMSRTQGAFMVVALRDRCTAYLRKSLDDGDGSSGPTTPDDTVEFGTNAMDNPLGIDMSAVIDGVAATTVGTLIGNTTLVAVCVLIGLIVTKIVKPALHRRLSTMEVIKTPSEPPVTTQRFEMDKGKDKRGRGQQQQAHHHRRSPSTFSKVRSWLQTHATCLEMQRIVIQGLLAVIHVLPSNPFPGSMYTSYTLLLQPSVTAALLLVAFSNGGGGQAGSAFGLVLGIVWLIPALWYAYMLLFGLVLGIVWLIPALWYAYMLLLRIRPLPLYTRPMVVQRRRGVPRWRRVLEALFHPNEVWMAPKGTSSQRSTPSLAKNGTRKFSRAEFRREFAHTIFDCYLCVFDVYRGDCHYFFVMELMCAIFLGVVGAAALGAPSEDACAAAVWGSWCVIGGSCVLLVSVCILRPFTVWFDLIVLVSGTMLCIASEVAALQEDDELGGVLLIVTSWSQVLFLLLNLSAEWAEGDGSHRRRLVELHDDEISRLSSFPPSLNSNPDTSIINNRRSGRTQDHHRSVPALTQQLHEPHALFMSPAKVEDLRRNRRPIAFLEMVVREICDQNARRRQQVFYDENDL
ncbi:membrane-associated protein, putative [Bodo saltans]|uniref:Membrane-associated protein, putative n=1 Tax=Bodo saltans TaxID=75058 RepID=A0A0S4JMK7_BODSA|nr:membrane-associated protein, putative [Bodo saltans]|eukprot:CUG91398.1 membrane-associated protein, putative [Bodo saltans]